MPRIRTMGAGLGGSTAKNVNVNANTGGGNKKQGLSTTTNKRVQFVSSAIKNRSYGENRNVIFCVNQLGGVGAVSGGNGSRMFGTTSDGVKDCITGPYGCEQVVREAYLEAYGREPDKSGLRTYCIAMTKRRWSKADVIADLEKNVDSLAPIYASLAGCYRMGIFSPDLEPVQRTVKIDSLGNITGTDTLKIGKITVNSATEYSLTMDEYSVTNAPGVKDKYNAGSLPWLGNGMPKIDACELYFYQDEPPMDILFAKDTDEDGVDDFSDVFPENPNETVDTDGDGVGDNSDAFPEDPNETVDTDGDGVGDNSDAFPNDPNETVDTDGDGVGDNADDKIGEVLLFDYPPSFDGTPGEYIATYIQDISNIIEPPLTGEEEWTSKTFAEYLQNNWTLSINRDLETGVELAHGEWSEFSSLAPYRPDDAGYGGHASAVFLETTPVFTEGAAFNTQTVKIKLNKK